MIRINETKFYFGSEAEKPVQLQLGDQYFAIDTKKLYLYDEKQLPTVSFGASGSTTVDDVYTIINDELHINGVPTGLVNGGSAGLTTQEVQNLIDNSIENIILPEQSEAGSSILFGTDALGNRIEIPRLEVQGASAESFVDVFSSDQNIFTNDPTDYVIGRIDTSNGNIEGFSNRLTVIEYPIPSYASHIYFSAKDRTVFYDKDKNIIPSTGATGGQEIIIEIDPSWKYISYSLLVAQKDTEMVAFSSEMVPFKTFEQPSRGLPGLVIIPEKDTELPLNVVLPEYITHTVGDDTKFIYNYGTVAVNNIDNYDFKWTTNYPNNDVFNQHRGLSLMSNLIPGTYDVSLIVRDDNYDIVGFAESKLKVNSAASSVKDKKILIVSDSWWDGEDFALNLINLGDSPFETTGTKTTAQSNLHEARGGARSESYLSRGDGSAFVTPFLNTAGDGIDFDKYLNDNNIDCDVVLIQFGLNGFSRIEGEITDIEDLIIQLNQTGMSSRRVILANPPMKGINGGTEEELIDRRKIIQLKEGYKDIASRISNVSHLDLAINFDSQYNFLAKVETPVNAYNPTAVEFKATQIIHPLNETYAQVARAVENRAIDQITNNPN